MYEPFDGTWIPDNPNVDEEAILREPYGVKNEFPNMEHKATYPEV